MNGILRIFLAATVLPVAGCFRVVGPATEPVSKTVVPFWVSTNGTRCGFQDAEGNVVVPAQYWDVDQFFCEGFTWVDTEFCEHAFRGHVPEEHWAPFPTRGTFFDSAGRPLPLSHAHSVHVTWDGDSFWMPPRFDHGLAFVRLEDGSICGLTTNGMPLAVHDEFGMFADSSANPEIEDDWYWHYRGDWAIVGLADGRLGILDGNRRFCFGPTNDAAAVKRRWRGGFCILDPLDFPDAEFCRWLDMDVDIEAPMLLPLEKLCYFLYLAIAKTEGEYKSYASCNGYDARDGILIARSPKTIRDLLDKVRFDNQVFPLVSRAGIYFVSRDQSKEN